MEVVTEELSGEHRLFGIRDCDKTFVTAFFPTISQVKGARKIARNESDKIKAHQIKPRS